MSFHEENSKKSLMFQKNYARIEVDIEKGIDGADWQLLQRSWLVTDGYTFFREGESPAESSLKNKVIIDFHTGAAAENRQQILLFPVAADVSTRYVANESFLLLCRKNLGGTAELFRPLHDFARDFLFTVLNNFLIVLYPCSPTSSDICPFLSYRQKCRFAMKRTSISREVGHLDTKASKNCPDIIKKYSCIHMQGT